MKELILLILPTPWGKLCKIYKQTHRREGFSYDGRNIFRNDGFELRSSSRPQVINNGLYVLGDETKYDDEFVNVPSEAWLYSLKRAVRAYNTAFGGGNTEVNINERNVEIIK
jgi:hypothetical protein